MKFFPDFNQLQVDLLVGTLLGDGNLQNVGQSWRYRVLQKTAHIDYVNFKYGILKDFVNDDEDLINLTINSLTT